MKMMILRALSLVVLCGTLTAGAQAPQPLKMGYSITLTDITAEKLAYAKSVGMDYIETSFGGLIDKQRRFTLSDEELTQLVRSAKEAAERAGVRIWSIHMPYGPHIDLSLPDEAERRAVVALHRRVLGYARLLAPEVILFHPSYYMGLNEREQRKRQLVRSVKELRRPVKALGAIMVIENMLGYELLADARRERPLGRTVEEVQDIMSRLPRDVYAAVDMNHIHEPARLIRALGARVRSIHVADGYGRAENHFMPCSGQGHNNWTDILSALHEAGYRGPFLFECKYQDVRELTDCYRQLYQAFAAEKFGAPAR